MRTPTLSRPPSGSVHAVAGAISATSGAAPAYLGMLANSDSVVRKPRRLRTRPAFISSTPMPAGRG
jgi:hypothetical protein